MNRVAIIDSGVANLASVLAAFAALGEEASVVRQLPDVAGATHLVLPGVGAFGPALETLRRRGLDEQIRRDVAAGKPLLAICLGLQLLTEGSDESPGVTGLGLVAGRCRRLPDGRRIPHLGWNGVTAAGRRPRRDRLSANRSRGAR